MLLRRPRQFRARLLALVLTGLVAWPWAQEARAEDIVETALVGPGMVRVTGLGEVPGVLSRQDEIRYGKIFAAQETGDWATADRLIDQLGDLSLMGHVLAQRYLHPTAYRSRFKELRSWMANYADHPQARRIHRLGVHRMPKGVKRPQPPNLHSLPALRHKVNQAPPRSGLGRSQSRQARRIKAQVRSRVSRGWPTGARQVLAQPIARKLLSPMEYDEGRRDIARGYYQAGKDAEALASADRAAANTGAVPLAHWWGGLAAWRMGRIEDALRHFSALATSSTASDWNTAAGAYWAARASLLARKPADVNRWLSIGAAHPFTFYGLLSRRALSLDLDYDWTLPGLSRHALAAITSTEQGARAIALLQVGRDDVAEKELQNLAGARPDLIPVIMALASRTAMPALSLRLSRRIEDGGAPAAALYPLPRWVPEGGFELDRALVYAFIRQESSFKIRAQSPAGARGLMQLMPRTASFIGRRRALRGSERYRLFDPEFNMKLGQSYLDHLLDNNSVDGDLFRLATAYNAGPGNLRLWSRKVSYQDDPLLFIESLPLRETRIFIERVLTNLWIYRHRMGQPTPSLDAVVAGDWPGYTGLDNARNGYVSN